MWLLNEMDMFSRSRVIFYHPAVYTTTMGKNLSGYCYMADFFQVDVEYKWVSSPSVDVAESGNMKMEYE